MERKLEDEKLMILEKEIDEERLKKRLQQEKEEIEKQNLQKLEEENQRKLEDKKIEEVRLNKLEDGKLKRVEEEKKVKERQLEEQQKEIEAKEIILKQQKVWEENKRNLNKLKKESFSTLKELKYKNQTFETKVKNFLDKAKSTANGNLISKKAELENQIKITPRKISDSLVGNK